MFYSTDGISIFIKKNFQVAKPAKKTILFLHGFGGSSSEWEEICSLLGSDFQLLAIDLPGFGKSSKPRSEKFYTSDFLVQVIEDILIKLKLDEVVLAGYSMGGRLALQYANSRPKKLTALILESSSAGIKTVLERQSRKQSDAELISIIKKKSLLDFFSFWQHQPLFNSQKNLSLEMQHSILSKKILENSKIGLSNSLKYFGQGEVGSLWQDIPKINLPVLLLSGSLDSKYTSIQNEMCRLLPHSTHKIIAEAGHNLHLEKPEVFVNLIKEFLQIL